MSTNWLDDSNSELPRIAVEHADGFPPPDHPAESGVFARHEGVPGHVQERLDDARVTIIGAGGLGSWVALALARSGVRHLLLIDNDVYDRTNASRQLMFPKDLRQPKAFRLAANVVPHMIAGGDITGIHQEFEDVFDAYGAVPADVLIVLVDNNECRLQAARTARQQRIPAVFSMMSGDSMRVHTFLQGSGTDDACLWCALPNLDPTAAAPCASATIASCLMSAAHVTFFAYRSLMGWPVGADEFNWRATDLLTCAPEEACLVKKRSRCALCA